MSDTDSFIDEVTEEVRRDHLFQLLRRYGWIAVVLVLGIVGSAAYLEWQKARSTAAAQATGDAILAAMEENDPAARVSALQAIALDSPEAQGVVDLIAANEAAAAGNTDEAVALLQAVAGNGSVSIEMQQMAAMRALMVQGDTLSAAERQMGYEALAAPGQPYRMLAEEQLALIEIELGQVSAGIERLEAIRADAETSSGLRARAAELIVALGGKPAQVNDLTGLSGN